MHQGLTIIQLLFLLSTILVVILTYFGTLEAAYTIVERDNDLIFDPKSETKRNLHLLDRISDAHIRILNNEKIFRIEQLQGKIKTEQDTLDYSYKLNVYKNLVENWVKLGEFSILSGITQDYIEILNMVGIKTVPDLSNQDPEALFDKINGIKTQKPLPTLGMLRHWHRKSILLIEMSI
jgi:hypothetical protein